MAVVKYTCHNRPLCVLAAARVLSRLASRPKPRLRDSSAPNGPVAPIENLGIPICSHLEALEVEADADHVEGIVVHQPTGNVLKTSRPSAQIWPAGSTPETATSAAPEHGQSTPQAAPSYGQPWSNRPRWAPGRAAMAWPYGPCFRQRQPLAQVVLEAHEQLAHLVHLDGGRWKVAFAGAVEPRSRQAQG